MHKDSKQKILYGAGAMGKRAYEYYAKDNSNSIYCFADTFKGGTIYCGKPVISFEELKAIYHDYDIVICIFNLFELVHDFEEAGIISFHVWDDYFLVSEKEMEEQCNDLLRTIDKKKDSRKKILYGAGVFGTKALHYYGSERVFAFVDRKKGGTNYLDKPVFHPSELKAMCETYDIIICVQQYDDVVEYLDKVGIVDFQIFIGIGDVRVDNLYAKILARNMINDSRIINELKEVDFIDNPELINTYYPTFLASARKSIQVRPEEEKIATRFIEENKVYGYFDSMLHYANRDLEFYEAPAVSHGFHIIEMPTRISWYNLIEPGELMRSYIHKNYKDCLYFTVGPYFSYADSFYSEAEISSRKKKLGKNLTVFPVHSIPSSIVNYDYHDFVKIVLEEARGFDSLTICTYFTDYNSEVVQLFKASGVKIVTAGYHVDPSFVKRLKTIMLLSDAIITNDLGSHVNHALSLNKPVKLINNQSVNMDSIFDNFNEWYARFNSSDRKQKTLLETDDYQITKEQLAAFEPASGFTKVKTKEEMGAIFDLSRRIIQNCDYKRYRYTDSIRQTYRHLQKSISPDERLQFRLMKEALPPDYDDYLKRMGV